MTTQNDSTIGALRARIARGELTHEALIEQVLDGAAQPAAANVFTRLYADAALAAARHADACLLYTSPSPRDLSTSRMPSSA